MVLTLWETLILGNAPGHVASAIVMLSLGAASLPLLC